MRVGPDLVNASSSATRSSLTVVTVEAGTPNPVAIPTQSMAGCEMSVSLFDAKPGLSLIHI